MSTNATVNVVRDTIPNWPMENGKTMQSETTQSMLTMFMTSGNGSQTFLPASPTAISRFIRQPKAAN